MKPKIKWPSNAIVRHEIDEDLEEYITISVGNGSERPDNMTKTNDDKTI